MYFPLRLVLKALELTYRTPPAQQILQSLLLLWTEQRAAQIPLRCLLHGLICTWNKPFKNETRRERKKERDPGREWEISSELPVTRLNSEHWVSLPSSYSQHQQTKGFSRKWTTTLFFLFYFHSLGLLSAWHTAVCSCCFHMSGSPHRAAPVTAVRSSEQPLMSTMYNYTKITFCCSVPV